MGVGRTSAAVAGVFPGRCRSQGYPCVSNRFLVRLTNRNGGHTVVKAMWSGKRQTLQSVTRKVLAKVWETCTRAFVFLRKVPEAMMKHSSLIGSPSRPIS